ncbi:MAG: HAMP domain-containing sensor histidine kinase [Cyanobacteria bacterium P01_H01_bin.26]
MYATPHSAVRNRQEVPSAEIRQLCQSQIDRLSEKLPVLDVWLVCWNQLENKRDLLSSRRYDSRHETEADRVQSYLESEHWLTENLSFLELVPLSLRSGDSRAYVCGLGKTDTHWNYLLLWAEQRISRPHRNLVKEYGQLLQQYLTLHQENLRQRAKIRLLEQTLQQADHQLRNPLSLIRLYAETISLGAESNTQRQQADCIRQTTEAISSNLGDLLNCSKQTCLRQQEHALSVLLQNVITLLTPRIKDKRLTIVYPPQPVSLIVDGWQFEQVLQNVLDNAIHFSPPGGTITVDWHVSQHETVVSIRDQGPGLAGSESSVFDPFYSKRAGGTGLGLAIAKKIILDHQGSIRAETLAQGGAQFSIVLPR